MSPIYRSAGRLGPEHVGARVTVRRHLAEGGLGDVVGVLEAIDAREVVVRDRRGDRVVIAIADITATRVIGE